MTSQPKRRRGAIFATLVAVAAAVTLVSGLTSWAGAAGASGAAAPSSLESPGTEASPSVSPSPDPSPSVSPSPTATATPPPVPTWRTIGRSIRDRPIRAIVFGTGAYRVLFIGGTHGNEYGTGVAKAFAAWLRRHPGAVPSGVQIHIIRCQNPDGLWAGTRGNARNVDLNRNYPTPNWTRILDPLDPSRWMGLWGGSRPGSEPETRAVLRYLRRDFSRLVTLHSTAGLIDWNGSGGRRIALRLSRICGLPLGHLSYQSHIHGSLGQFFPRRYGHIAITVELRQRGMTVALRRALLAAARP